MPSQLAHLIFALESLKPFLDLAPLLSDLSLDPDSPLSEFNHQALVALNHGAQMPDMFYHNRRSKPSGLYISVALHRRGFAQVTKSLLTKASGKLDLPTVFSLAFLSHGILDRNLHPWINFRSGWVVPSQSHTDAWRHLHVVCERLIDHYCCSWKNMKNLNSALFPKLYATDLVPEIASRLVDSLKQVYPRCLNDTQLQERFENAKNDANGFYHWSMGLSSTEYCDLAKKTQACLHARSNGYVETAEQEDILHYVSLLHPRVVNGIEPCNQTILSLLSNSNRQEWVDPCYKTQVRTESLQDLWGQALKKSHTVIDAYLHNNKWQLVYDQLIHDGDLRSEFQEGACHNEDCQPIDWIRMLYQNFPDLSLEN